MQSLIASEEIKDRLSPVYKYYGNNGMPWGRWDPQYLLVGISAVLMEESNSED
jgi:hypothetical protein